MRRHRGWLANASAAAVLTGLLSATGPVVDEAPGQAHGVVRWHDDEVEGHEVAALDVDGAEGTVYRLYRAYFLREPDAGGFTYWLTQHRWGYPLDAISEDFARSTEFVGMYGSLTDQQFVDRVYVNVLGREPDQGGYDYWLRQMAAGLRRGGLMLAFSDSEEFRQKTATSVPLLPVTPDPDDPTAYEILNRDQDGDPIRWNPCRPVRVVANYTGAPAGVEPILRAAVQRLAAATGVGWTYAGTTTDRASDHTGSNLMTASADREVVVSWPATWTGTSAGMGGAAWATSATGETWFVAGSVQGNRTMQLTDPQMLHLLLHELGHVAGLAHPAQEYQVMSRGGRLDLSDYRAGDRAGLTVVGRNGTVC